MLNSASDKQEGISWGLAYSTTFVHHMSNLDLEIQSLDQWAIPNAQTPFIVAGPCSAETEEQVMETAHSLAQNGAVKALRAGIWKPRTRPNSFEGVGEIGLEWLANAQQETGLPAAVEVANSQHVELALKHGIKILWLGARTTVNPFSVQEIADSLVGTDVPIMVKNPINPDVNLWVGAIERIYKAGIHKIVAIHRGFSSYDKRFRYAPHWEIPIQLKTMLPELPMICDPSHITGLRENVQSVAQKALDLDMDGLIVEVHPRPDEAWSDPKQQVTPNSFLSMVESLQFRSSSSESIEFTTRLEKLRGQIDEIDAELIAKLASRFTLVQEIGSYKKENDVTILQLNRWKEILSSRLDWGERNAINSSFLKRMLHLIHDESIRLQTEIMNDIDAKSRVAEKNR